MSKLQFLSIIITTASSFVLVIIAWMQSNVRMSRIKRLLDNVVHRQGEDTKGLREEIAGNAKGLREAIAANTKGLREEIAADMKEIRDRLTTIDNHLMTFYTVTGRLEGRIDELSRR